MRHIHAEIIKAWADGSEVQLKNRYHNWRDTKNPTWHETYEYRIKPTSTSDYVQYICFDLDNGATVYRSILFDDANLKLIFDGKTKELKSAEVIK